MNKDGRAYSLATAYDRLLVTCSTSRDHKPDEARSWRAKRRKFATNLGTTPGCVIEYCFGKLVYKLSGNVALTELLACLARL